MRKPYRTIVWLGLGACVAFGVVLAVYSLEVFTFWLIGAMQAPIVWRLWKA